MTMDIKELVEAGTVLNHTTLPALDDTDSWLDTKEILEAYNREEAGDADLLAILYMGRIVFDHAEKSWYLWNGQHWERDKTGQVINFVSNQVAAQYHWAAAELRKGGHDPDLEKAVTQRARQLCKMYRVKNVLSFAQSHPNLNISGEGWDTNPWLLGVRNGVINLRTGVLDNGLPGDYIRTISPTEWESLDTKAPLWEQFLLEILSGKVEVINFLQRLLGFGLIGMQSEHILPILWGRGRNGKDTLLETLRAVLGNLAGVTSSDVLLANRWNKDAATPSINALRGKRIAWVSETNEGARFNEGQVKLLTGGGAIAARPLHGEIIEFTPAYLLMLVTNEKPQANPDDYALWKRVLLIEFNQSFVDTPRTANEHKRIKGLSYKLQGEAPGILAWLVRGCLEWQHDGLSPPQKVIAATQNYKHEVDELGEYFSTLVQDENLRVRAADLYQNYQAFCADNGLNVLGKAALGRKMGKRYERKKISGQNYYIGIGLPT